MEEGVFFPKRNGAGLSFGNKTYYTYVAWYRFFIRKRKENNYVQS